MMYRLISTAIYIKNDDKYYEVVRCFVKKTVYFIILMQYIPENHK